MTYDADKGSRLIPGERFGAADAPPCISRVGRPAAKMVEHMKRISNAGDPLASLIRAWVDLAQEWAEAIDNGKESLPVGVVELGMRPDDETDGSRRFVPLLELSGAPLAKALEDSGRPLVAKLVRESIRQAKRLKLREFDQAWLNVRAQLLAVAVDLESAATPAGSAASRTATAGTKTRRPRVLPAAIVAFVRLDQEKTHDTLQRVASRAAAKFGYSPDYIERIYRKHSPKEE